MVTSQDTKEIHRINKMFVFYKQSREQWLKRALEYEMVVHNDVEGTGTQFTKQQLQEIKDKYLIGTSINFTLPVVETLQAFLTANQPVPDVIPVGNTTKTKAYFFRELLKACLNTNNFPDIQDQIVKDGIISGRGVIFMKPSTYYEYNAFNVTMEALDYRYYYPDPTSKLRSHQDAEAIIIAKPLLSERAKKLYNLTEEEIKYATSIFEGGDYTIDNPLYNRFETTGSIEQMGQLTVWIQEIFEKNKAKLYITEDGQKTFTQPKPYLNKQGRLTGFVLDVKEEVFIKRTVKVGNFIKSQEMLPITMYPTIVYGHTHNRSPFEYGVIHQFIDLNYSLNKFVQIIIENAQQSSNANWTAPTGAVNDKAKWEKDSARAGALLEYEYDASKPDGARPQRNQPLPINNAFYTLFTIFKSLIEYLTGVLPLLQGNSEGAPETVGATNTLANFGMQRPKLYARRIDSANNLLGKLIIQMYQAFAPAENVLRYQSNTSAMTEIMTNIRVKIEQTPEGQRLMQTNDPNGQLASIVQSESQKESMVIFEDITAGDFDVIFKSTNNLPSTRAQAVEFLRTLLGRMSSDAMSIAVVEALFNLADVAEADEVLRNMNAIQQATQELDQAKQVNEQLNKELEKLQSKLEQQILATKEAEIESAVEVRKAKADALLSEMEGKVKEEKAEEKAEARKKKVEYS